LGSSGRSGAVFSSVAAAFSEKKPVHPQLSPPAPSRLKAGFVGCGTIASAIATGLMTQKQIQVESVAVTKRSREKSAALQEAFPELVHVQDSGQDVVDQSDVIFVCVLPQQTSQVLRGLKFDQERHTLVSLVVRVAIRLLAAVVAFPTNLSNLIFSSNTSTSQRTVNGKVR
jgi:pyrroline-5-carboxylate reductase